MKNSLFICLILCCSVLFVAGCAKSAGSSSEAIQNSQALNTVQEKVDYLVKQAEAFYNSKEFKSAVETAQYILSNLDSNSAKAKDLIEKAKTQLQAAAQKAVSDVSNKLLGK